MKHEPRLAFHMEKPLLTAVSWAEQKLRGYQGRANGVSQVDGVSGMALACQFCDSVGGGSEKGQWPLPTCISGRKLSLTLSLMSDNSVPPCTSLVLFKLLPQFWSSEGVSLSKSVCGFFRRNCMGVQNFLLLTQSPLLFAARNYEDLSS